MDITKDTDRPRKVRYKGQTRHSGRAINTLTTGNVYNVLQSHYAGPHGWVAIHDDKGNKRIFSAVWFDDATEREKHVSSDPFTG